MRELASFSGGWCGHINAKILPSTAKKVQSFLQTRPSVLHLDELINKKDAEQVRFVLQALLDHGTPIQVAFLQGAVPLQSPALFAKLEEFLCACPVWSLNLGELRFSDEQCRALGKTLERTGVTHM